MTTFVCNANIYFYNRKIIFLKSHLLCLNLIATIGFLIHVKLVIYIYIIEHFKNTEIYHIN